MALTNTTQAQPNLYKRIRRKLHRIKRLTIGYIKNMRAYKAYRKYRHHITGPLRMARADALREDHQEQKKHQEQARSEVAVQFTPLYLSRGPVTPIPVSVLRPEVAGKPLQVQHPGEFVKRYHEELARLKAEGIPTQPTALRPVTQEWIMDIFTPIVPEVLPDEVGVTQQDAEFLLDRAFPHQEEVTPEQTTEADPDMTTKRPAVKKAG